MSTTLQSANTAALGPYLRNFALAYLGIAVLTATLVWFLNITNSAMGVVSVMAAASLPAQQFVKKISG